MLFDAGAAEVHVRISSPPVIGQCFYGIDLADPDEMIASTKTVEEVREYIGATSLAYLSHDGLVEATSRPESELCRALPDARVSDRGTGGACEAPVRAGTCLRRPYPAASRRLTPASRRCLTQRRMRSVVTAKPASWCQTPNGRPRVSAHDEAAPVSDTAGPGFR